MGNKSFIRQMKMETTYQNLEVAAKVVLRGRFKAIKSLQQEARKIP